jgi:hypothetical protein
VSGFVLPKRLGDHVTIEAVKTLKFVSAAVFDCDVKEGDQLGCCMYMAAFAYKVMLDMHIESQQAVSILRFFRQEFMEWDEEAPFILSLNDGKYAVVITKPECRRIYDYKEDVDRTHPTQAIPLPAPVVQASVNLSKVIELELQIR